MTQGTPASSQIIWLEGRVQELEAQVAALTKDAERYRFIRQSDDWMVICGERQSPYFMGEPLDRNIDAAMAQRGTT